MGAPSRGAVPPPVICACDVQAGPAAWRHRRRRSHPIISAAAPPTSLPRPASGQTGLRRGARFVPSKVRTPTGATRQRAVNSGRGPPQTPLYIGNASYLSLVRRQPCTGASLGGDVPSEARPRQRPRPGRLAAACRAPTGGRRVWMKEIRHPRRSAAVQAAGDGPRRRRVPDVMCRGADPRHVH